MPYVGKDDQQVDNALERHADLQGTMREFLRARDMLATEAMDPPEGATASLEPPEIFEATTAFQAQYADFDRDNVALMLCCFAVRAPLPAEEALSKKEGATVRWEQWLTELRGLPSDAPEWETVTDFVESVQQLGKDKRREREASREQLRRALASLQDQATADLAYFELEVASWTAEVCPFAEATALAAQVTQLQEALSTHRHLRQQRGVTLTEDRHLRHERDRLAEFILQTHAHLSTALTVSPPENPAPHTPAPKTPLPHVEEATPQEEGTSQKEEQEDMIPCTSSFSTSAEPMRVETGGMPASEPATDMPPPEGPLPHMEEGPSIEAGQEETIALDTSSSSVSESTGVETHGAPAAPEPTAEISPEDSTGVFTRERALPEAESTTLSEKLEVQDASIVSQELRSSQEVAGLLQTDDRAQLWHALLWTLIAEDDVLAAYWLTRSLVASGRTVPVPDWLLAAVQGARWLAPGSETFVSDLLAITKTSQPTSDDVQVLLGLAAALRPALIAPVSGMLGWLSSPSWCPALHDLVTAVHTFASTGIALRPEDLLGVTGAEQREAALTEAAHAVRRWLDEALGQRLKFKRASDVWRSLVGPGGALRELLLPVSEDRRGEVEQVRERLHQWQQPESIAFRLQQLDLQLVGRKVRPIVGPPQRQLVRDVEEACHLVRRWCDLVDHAHHIETRGSWLFEQVSHLRITVQQALPEVEHTLAQLSTPAQPIALSAAASCLRRAVKQLSETLNLTAETPAIAPLPMQMWEWCVSETDRLALALSRRLLWLPELSLSEDGQPLVEILPTIARVLSTACVEGRSVQTTFERWLHKQDYRFIERLLEAMRNEMDAADMSRQYQEALDGSQEALRARLADTNAAIEQAVVDGIIDEATHSAYSARVVAMQPEDILHFAPRYAELDQVRHDLVVAHKNRLAALHEEWRDLENRLTGSHIEPARQEEIRAFMAAALEREDTRVIEECIACLLEMFDVGSDAEEGWFRAHQTRDVLAECTRVVPGIERWLEQAQGLETIVKDMRQGRTQADLRFAQVPGPRLDEAVNAITAWRRLKQQRPRTLESTVALMTLLRYLGFDLEPGAGTTVRIERRGEDWVHARATMSVSDFLVKPIPQFGSQAQGRYDVICLWERPGAETIAARLRELRLTSRNVLMVYLGRLTRQQQRDITRTCREQELALAVLDEILLLFLAPERNARLPIFLRCALPFTALNPYTPFQAGDVPPEMFFGRETMARELQRPAGSCLVYGGRQLGKSALLRHVLRQFHHPEHDQFAWVENMKLIVDPLAGKGPTNVWGALREEFKGAELMPARVTTDRPEEVTRYIREAMLQDPQRRALVMFDEADDFLDADSRDGFRVVLALRELMLETQRRFKVIFAGLHNVQRFQGIPNQPLAHFGTPLCVGPLEPVAAQQLVRQPLETLGYRFADDATVLRVLSYTNYHPGLIQLFCQELLKRLHMRPGNASPPYNIGQNDVEAVYRLPQVRERIRERFDWTLALDARYQAIAWSMIWDQMGVRDGYARTYPPGDILQLVREWWPQGFGDMSTEQLRSLLDELGGLGVLVRNADGHSRLRSPNLVRLMGTEGDIENRLLELSQREPPSLFDADSHHTPLDPAAQYYSPLSYAQERSLTPPQFGVGLIFASEALGFARLPETFKHFIAGNWSGSPAMCTEIPAAITDGEQLLAWLDQYLQTHERQERLIVYQQPSDSAWGNLVLSVRPNLEVHRRWR